MAIDSDGHTFTSEARESAQAIEESPLVVPRFARGTMEQVKAAPLDARGVEVVEIAHDLRSPLATIALELELLQERLAGGDDQDARAFHRIANNIRFMERLVHDMLDAAALEADRMGLQRESIELVEFVAGVLDRVVPTRDRARVSFVFDERIRMSIDPGRIERVIANLVGNALKYSPTHGKIAVELERVRAYVRIAITDAGPGLTAEEMAFVFDRFRRTDAARRTVGSGLGLFVSKQIVDAHGGELAVASTPGLGSRFYFKLPLG